VRLEVSQQGVDFGFEAIRRPLRSEILLVDVDVAEEEETVRAVAAAVVDQQRVTAELRRRDYVEVFGVDVVAVPGEQELEVEGRESSEAGFVERLRVDFRLGLGEEFVVVLPENRALRGDGFEAVAMQMVCEFTCDRVEAVEVGVELVVALDGPDEPTVTKPLEDAVDRVAVVVAPVGDLG
jgi:stage V sporulation protein SpoVS